MSRGYISLPEKEILSMWVCRKCGACCKSPFTKFWLPEYWDEDNKRCQFLTEDDLCSRYESRPEQCRDIDFKKLPRGEEFRTVWCDFMDKNINKEKRYEK